MTKTDDQRGHVSNPVEPETDRHDPEDLGLEDLWQLCERYPIGSSHDPMIGREIGGVTLHRLIGEGGMGRVYEGIQRPLDRLVAVKFLSRGLPTPEALRRFMTESVILAQLSHPGIARIFSAGTHQIAGIEVPFMVMEHVTEACAITDFVAGHCMPVHEVVGLFHEVCVAIGHAHACGIVHRDLKPENILVDAEGRPKVIDFGVASVDVKTPTHARLTKTGQLIGTLQYMSPEQVRGEKVIVGPAGDVYSLGVVLYEMLCGSPPYDLSQAGLVDAASIILDAEPPLLRVNRPDIPLMLEEIAVRCLRKESCERFVDAGALAAAVNGFLQGTLQHTTPSLVIREAKRAEPRGHGGRLAQVLVGILALMALSALGFVRALPLLPQSPQAEKIDESFVLLPCAGRSVFSCGIRDVFDSRIDGHIIESSGVRRCERSYLGLRITSWIPEQTGIEGHLLFRFDFPEPARHVVMRASFTCLNGEEGAGAIGGATRGAAAVEISTDGESWTTLVDHIGPKEWGRNWGVDSAISADGAEFPGLWVRVRMLCESSDDNPAGVEFCRSTAEAIQDVFQVVAFAE